jgi:hypothetical protein
MWHPNRRLGNVMGWSYSKNLENSWAIRDLVTWDFQGYKFLHCMRDSRENVGANEC